MSLEVVRAFLMPVVASTSYIYNVNWWINNGSEAGLTNGQTASKFHQASKLESRISAQIFKRINFLNPKF